MVAQAASVHSLLTLEEAAAISRTTIGTIRHWISVGKIESVRPGRRRLIRRTDLARHLGLDASELVPHQPAASAA